MNWADSGEAAASARQASAFGVARLTIDLGAIRRNYLKIGAGVAPATVGAVVKADAYGLGARPVASALWRAGCRTFFVANLKEAVALKTLRLAQTETYVLNGLSPGSESLCRATGALPVLNSLPQAMAWLDVARRSPAPLGCALQVDTGMSRLGLSPPEALCLVREPGFLAHLDVRLLISQLACADDRASAANLLQRQRFEALADLLPGVRRSLANSAGGFLGPEYHYALMRPGLALYGVAPCAEDQGRLEPVVSLEAPVLQTRVLAIGEGVGYGLTYRPRYPRRLATVALGYADGWPRRLGGRGAAWFQGVRLPIVGRVSMDCLTLDVTDLPEGALQAGDGVQMLGPSQSAANVAADADTIAYEILTGLGRRLERRYRDMP